MYKRAIQVLLVEDNPGDARYIRRLLAEASSIQSDGQIFNLTCVETLASGLDSLLTQSSDVVLLDLSLPDSQGLGTLATVQAVAPALPIVVLTGLADQQAALMAMQHGAQDYLVKGHVDTYALSNSIRYARERKQLLEELRRHTASLEEQNAELDAFAHTVAHDLKNHVFTVVGNVEMLLDAETETEMVAADAATDRAEQREMLAAILRSGQKMTQIIEELLLLAQVRRTEVQVAPVDMFEIVEEAQARVMPLLIERGAQLSIGDPDRWPTAVGYAPWIEEVWYNYISNAIKYGGSPPRVELGAERQGDDRVCFWVRDNGQGLTARQMEKLFAEFTRLHSQGAGGHGLGLSIAKRIIDRLGGEVSVQSQPGAGSTFRFTLPAA
jgi:signal transduction histidine kinase